ncbi:MAG: nucleotidyltransferase domain-containing protein [Candidatus Rokubacteria bacterium]|nr:nucleotidyltransferase domain-containing protein [Candidatus Rokubacteria bacterium]
MDTQRIEEIARTHGILLMLRFGSTVSGRTHPRSDLDIAVLLVQPALSLAALADLTHDVQTLFPGQDVDLAVINHADPLFLKQVTENCSLLYGLPGRLLELKCYAFRRYQDHRRYLAMERDYVARSLGQVPSP